MNPKQENILSFSECANYRGALQVKLEEGRYFWRVDCDLEDNIPWHEIPAYLGRDLVQHAKDMADAGAT